MSARSIASLSVVFGLVTVPVKLHPATRTASGAAFHLLHAGCGSRLRQQYVCAREQVVVDRSEVVKGYEFSKDQYVTFTPDELRSLEDEGAPSIEVVTFVPLASIDPILFDKAYYLAPDRGGARSFALLAQAMREMDRCAIGRWTWRGRQNVVMLRTTGDGLVLQQLFYADELRSPAALEIATGDVKSTELALAKQLIEANSTDAYDPAAYVDEVARRIEHAVERKVEGKEVTVGTVAEVPKGNVIDLMEALRASLKRSAPPRASGTSGGTRATTARPVARRAAAAAATATRRGSERHVPADARKRPPATAAARTRKRA